MFKLRREFRRIQERNAARRVLEEQGRNSVTNGWTHEDRGRDDDRR